MPSRICNSQATPSRTDTLVTSAVASGGARIYLLTRQLGDPGPPWPAPARHHGHAKERGHNQAAAVASERAIKVAARRTPHARNGECSALGAPARIPPRAT